MCLCLKFVIYLYILNFLLNKLQFTLGVSTVRFGQFWRGFLHHTYRVRFHPMLDHTSLLEGKNWSTQGAVNLSGLVWFVRLYGYGKKKLCGWVRKRIENWLVEAWKFEIERETLLIVRWDKGLEETLCGWEQKRREKWLGESLRFWDWEGRKMKVADD